MNQQFQEEFSKFLSLYYILKQFYNNCYWEEMGNQYSILLNDDDMELNFTDYTIADIYNEIESMDSDIETPSPFYSPNSVLDLSYNSNLNGFN